MGGHRSSAGHLYIELTVRGIQMNNLGPKTEPCGTLHTMYTVDDVERPYKTLNVLTLT